MTDERVSKPTQAHDVSAYMVHATLQKDIHLSKKSARWVNKMLYEKMKKEQVKICEAVLALIAAMIAATS
jgi:hypothetical protein